jgi:hypothetical protein
MAALFNSSAERGTRSYTLAQMRERQAKNLDVLSKNV